MNIRIKYLLLILILFNSTLIAQSTVADSLANLIKSEADDTNKIKHLLQLGWELKFADIDSSINLANQALKISASLENSAHTDKTRDYAAKKFKAKSYANIGIYNYFKGEFELSLEAHFKALEINESIQSKLAMQSCYNNIGLVYWKQGDYAKSLDNYFSALKINVDLQNHNQSAFNLNNIGLVYFDQGNFTKALEYHNMAYILNKRMGNEDIAATNLNNIGNDYFAEKKYKKARAYFLKALKLNEELGIQIEAANNLTNIGATYHKEGNSEMALLNIEKAHKIYTENADQYGMISTFINIGTIFVELKNYAKAEKPLLEALKISQEIGALERIKESSFYLSTLYSETNRYQLAFEHYRTYSETKDSLFNDEKSKEIGRIEMGHEFERKERDKAESLRIAKVKKERRNMLQYSGISIILVFTAIIIVFLGFKKVSFKTAEAVTFLSFLFLFEFLLMLLDPFIDSISKGEPAIKLLVNAVLAIAIFPLNSLLEKALKKRLVAK